MKQFFSDFKKFALKGNIIDMAVGVVIGGAFGKIVTSLVNDIITPLISLATGKVSLTELEVVLKPEILNEAGEVIQSKAAITYGNFIQTIIDFIIIALSIFCVLRVMMKAQNKFNEKEIEAANAAKAAADEAAKAAKEAADAEIAHQKELEELEVSLLREIRDSLKK